MKKIIFSIICILFSYTAIGQISPSSAMSDRDYVNLVNHYLSAKKNANAKLTLGNNLTYGYYNEFFLMPNNEYLTAKQIISLHGKEYYKCILRAITVDVPDLEMNKQDSFGILEKKHTVNQKQLVGGVSVIGISTVLFCASNAGLNQAIKEADSPNKIRTLNNAKIAMGIVCGVGALTGTILAICSIKTEIKINKNLQFDVSGNYIGLSKNF